MADAAYERLKSNPRHPSLHLKKIGRFWSVRVGSHHRALAVEESDGLVWFWIATRTTTVCLGDAPAPEGSATARP